MLESKSTGRSVFVAIAVLVVFLMIGSPLRAQLQLNGPNATLKLQGVDPAVADPVSNNVIVQVPGTITFNIDSGVNSQMGLILLASTYELFAPQFYTPLWGGSIDIGDAVIGFGSLIIVGDGISLTGNAFIGLYFRTDTATAAQPTNDFTFSISVDQRNIGSRDAWQSVVADSSNPPLFLSNSCAGDANYGVIAIPNIPPTANAGSGQVVSPGQSVALMGSGSDPDNGPMALQFTWTQTSGPTVVLSSTTVASPSFIAPQTFSTLTFSLVVDDGSDVSSPSSVSVMVAGSATQNLVGNDPSLGSGLVGSGSAVGSPTYSMSPSWIGGRTTGSDLAEEDSPHVCPPPAFVSECPIGLANGECRYAFEALTVPSVGIPFAFDMTYSSRADFTSAVGSNWDFSYNSKVTPIGGGRMSVTTGYGREDIYAMNSSGAFVPPPGVFDSLMIDTNGDVLRTTPRGLRHRYDGMGRLSSISDRAGNSMSIMRDASGAIAQIEDTQGRNYMFTYDSSGRLVGLADFRGRQVTFARDANGDLTSVTTPAVVGTPTGNDFPMGKTTRFTYSSGNSDVRRNHNLISVIEEPYAGTGSTAARPRFVNTYAATTNPNNLEFDRVVAQRIGHDDGGTADDPMGAVGGTTTFSYSDDLSTDAAAPPGAAIRTTMTDANGDVGVHHFNSARLEIRTIERTNRNVRQGEGDYVTDFTYDSESRLILARLPNGNSISYSYDSASPILSARRNLLEVRRRAGLVNASSDIVVRYTYEPVFQAIRTTTDPRAFLNGTVPLDASGRLDLSHPDVARWTTIREFDYQEGSGFQAASSIPQALHIPEGLGDRNGDGVTTAAYGSMIRTTRPTIATPGPNFGQTAFEMRVFNSRGQPIRIVDAEGFATELTYFPSNGVAGDAGDREGYLQAVVRDAGGLNLLTTFSCDTSGNVVSVIAPTGARTDFDVNERNQVVRRLKPALAGGLRYSSEFIYDAADRLIETRTANIDDAGIAYPHAVVVDSFEFDILDRVIRAKRDLTPNDSTGGIVTADTEFVYNSDLELVSIRSPEFVAGTPSGGAVTRTYDERGLVFRVVGGDTDDDAMTIPASTHSMTLHYDGNRNLVERIDAVANAVSTNAPTTAFPGAGNGSGDVAKFVYDGFDRRIESINGEGDRFTSTFNRASMVIETTMIGPVDDASTANVLLRKTQVDYDEVGRPIRSNGQHFDVVNGAPIGDGQNTTTFEYDRRGLVVATTDDHSHTETFVWDSVARLTTSTDHLGNGVTFIYDANGNVVTRITNDVSSDFGAVADTFTSMHGFDALDREVRSVDPNGGVREFFYDSRDNLVMTWDALRGQNPTGPGNVVRREYDALGRPTRMIRSLTNNGQGDGNSIGSLTTSRTYDRNSRVVGETDDGGRTTAYLWDRAGRRIATTFADGTVSSLTFDGDHHAITHSDANGTVCTQVFDGAHRLLSRNAAPGPGVIGSTIETFGYDGAGRMTRASNNDGFAVGLMDCRFAYDSFGNRTRDDQMGMVVVSRFDSTGNRVGIDYPDGSGGVLRSLSLTYDELDRLNSITESGQEIVGYHYRGSRRVERKSWGPVGAPIAVADSIYDVAARMISLDHLVGSGGSAPGTRIAGFEYGHDREYRQLYEKRLHDGGNAETYSYDSVGRVDRNDHDVPLAMVPPGTEYRQAMTLPAFPNRTEFVWDGRGNRTTSSVISPPLIPTLPPLVTTTTYARSAGSPTFDDEMNQYSSTTTGLSAAVPLTYDANGNITRIGVPGQATTRTFAYDFKNRLVEVRNQSNGALIARWTYDAGDRRVSKTTSSAASPPAGAVVHYIYDADECVEETDGANELRRDYVWGRDLDELVEERVHVANQMTTVTTSYFAHQNAVGSVVALTRAQTAGGAAGTVVERYEYDAFGMTDVVVNGLTGNPYRFHGARFDPETGFYHMRARSYAPSLGRFIQRDPLGVWGDSGNLGNAVAFVGNDPVGRRDPFGLRPMSQSELNPFDVDRSFDDSIDDAGDLWDAIIDEAARFFTCHPKTASVVAGAVDALPGAVAGVLITEFVAIVATPAVVATVAVAGVGLGSFRIGQSLYEIVTGEEWNLSGESVPLPEERRLEALGGLLVDAISLGFKGTEKAKGAMDDATKWFDREVVQAAKSGAKSVVRATKEISESATRWILDKVRWDD